MDWNPLVDAIPFKFQYKCSIFYFLWILFLFRIPLLKLWSLSVLSLVWVKSVVLEIQWWVFSNIIFQSSEDGVIQRVKRPLLSIFPEKARNIRDSTIDGCSPHLASRLSFHLFFIEFKRLGIPFCAKYQFYIFIEMKLWDPSTFIKIFSKFSGLKVLLKR